jgi:beta-lactam-binding protein with PASTA domain
MRPRRFSRRRDADPAARTTVVQPDAAVVEEEVVQRPPRPRPPEIWPWLLLLLLLVLGGLAAAYLLTRDDNDNKKSSAPAAVTIPNVVGMKQDAATQRLHQSGLASQILTRASKFPKGTVFAQAPGQGTKVAHGAQVQLTVSAVSLTKVPNVVGLKSSAAVERLKAAGLSTRVVPVAGAKAAGTVLSQSPAAAQSVGKGSTVSIKSSRGTATVPDVVGQNAAAAKSALTSAGLKPSVFTVPNAAAKGTVVAQKPIAATKAPRGSNVRINVSNGSQGGAATTSTTTTRSTTTTSAPATVQVPNVVGLQQGPAQRRLSTAHLGVRVLYVASQQPSGQVVSQSPSAGTSVKRGAKVTIRVSLGPSQAQTAVVPDVTGEDQQTATSQLQSAGFTVQVIEVPATDPSQAGTVLDEQPAGGTRAPKGSQITIYVGQSS